MKLQQLHGAMLIRGNLVHAPVFGSLEILQHGYLFVEDGVISDIVPVLRPEWEGLPVEDYGDALIVPSFTDLHLHGPQYAMLGLGMDLQLLDWLETYTFKTEAMFRDLDFARKVYRHLAYALVCKGTTRVCMFSSVHREATHVLMEELEQAGVTGFVGKVNMDRNCPDSLRETTAESLLETRRWVEECRGKYPHLAPMLTPRFTPSCSDELMRGLGELAQEYGLRVQSHLSENLEEGAWVRSLRPDCHQYWESYASCGLFGPGTVMAHCVYSDEKERQAIKDHGAWVAHCPDSNINIPTGVAPVRRMLNEGLSVALGSDIAGGAQLSMLGTAAAAIRASKRNWLLTNQQEAFLTVAEAFYLITSAGQLYFGEGPGFQKGNLLHALALDDSTLPPSRPLTISERLERLMYLGDDQAIIGRYSAGRKITI